MRLLTTAREHRARLVAAAAALAVLAVLTTVTIGLRGGSPAAVAADPPSTSAPVSAPPSTGGPGPGTWAPTTPDPDAALPDLPGTALTAVSVEVPSIGVRSHLLPLAVDVTGVLVPPDPYDVAGWFTGGPVPGEIGPAIIAGHVDSRAGPGVFFRLEEMRPGQAIKVTRSDGSVSTFTVRQVQSYPKTDFPTEAVYGPTPGHELRLITCGGDFDRSRRSYLDNIVVYAVLQGTTT
ncbi:MAG: class F sortase [Geodermatophilaceae bacterium]